MKNLILPENIKKLILTLEANNHKAYVIGGCVRDSIIGLTPNDWDITTDATPDIIMELFKDYEISTLGIDYGVVTVDNVEITTFRKDGIYTDHRRPDSIEFTDNLYDDVSRRDFTINAIAFNPREGFIDYYGGIDDIKNKIIRTIGDPYKRFNEDALRILRAIRFSIVLKYTIEPQTKEAIFACRDLIKYVTKKKIREELGKMKILYISDLDGTLLNSTIEVSDYATEQLNMLIESGMNFTVATARTAASTLPIMRNVNLKIPIILMNGVCIYDPLNKNYLKINYINEKSLQNMFETIKKYDLHGFVYSINDRELQTFYENDDSVWAKRFINERVQKYNKIFTKVDSFSECNKVVYYAVSDKKEKLTACYDELAKDENIHIEFYLDIYGEDEWYLEIADSNASKYNAVQFIRKAYDKVIGFGDNLNDIPLFKACDYCCAVENANPEVKKFAHEIIESNMNDGVIKWLLINYGHGFDSLIR